MMSEIGLTVKEFDPSEQPREKAMAHGCKVLSTAELWAIILRVGVPGTPITQLCRDLMKRVDGKLHELERLDREALLEVKGLGAAKVLQVEAVMELIRRYHLEKIDEKVKITSSKVIYQVMAPRIGNLDHEEIWCIFLNRQNQINEIRQMTSGSSTASIFDIKKAIRHALLTKAEGVVMCHNHPSGNLQPSPQDDQITRRLVEGCKVFELRMIDHLIVTSSGYYSYFDSGNL
ncbi:MAG: DNA repair protein RadC [Clostridium sp.]|nr:DNA repair protein RadC [Prevotella sp.]MCM1428310.1 DNA repair protein RadC [Clostridium sp.]